jgi:hypothetical protein
MDIRACPHATTAVTLSAPRTAIQPAGHIAGFAALPTDGQEQCGCSYQFGDYRADHAAAVLGHAREGVPVVVDAG